ncbi:hypothetical protein [Natrinema hispanicum]|uniref:Uncharacterized protein n=2 Tax=Natrinema hispanicum TaxID=392421 RepID=A0A1G6YAH4_9EURY|nr:hypothetical protein [Natrinema hispanicum]SDD86727.1 hypothetical protein SAMN05192552_10617 [Natrinema hispanicum]SEU09648.1 hypothetical protein SAMN04488694_14311 [Natrinema hispanicum]
MDSLREDTRGSGRLSRRAMLGGFGLIGCGAVLHVSDSFAFSQLRADRTTSIRTSNDETALLGISLVDSVETGAEETHLAALTNNTNSAMTISLTLEDPSQAELSTRSVTLASGGSTSVAISVANDSPTGTDALSVEFYASNNTGLSTSLIRSINVESGEQPSLIRNIRDRTENNTSKYRITYQVNNVSDFDNIKISVKNLDVTWAEDLFVERSVREGIVEYSQGGTEGNEHEFTFEVFDGTGTPVLSESVTDVSSGENPPGNEEPSNSDGPKVETFSIVDTTQWNTTNYSLDYEVSNRDNFEEVQVTFENTANDWATETVSNGSFPTGNVSYSQGGTEGDTYEITVAVINQNGITIDSESITHVSGSDGNVSYP